MSRWVRFEEPEPSRDDVIIDRLLHTNDELQLQIQDLHQQLREEQKAKDAAVQRLTRVSDFNSRIKHQNEPPPIPEEPEPDPDNMDQSALAEQMSLLFNQEWEHAFQSLSMDLIFKGKKDNDRHICSILFETFMDCFKFCSDTARAQLSDLEQNIADLTLNLHLEQSNRPNSEKDTSSDLSRSSTLNSDRSIQSRHSDKSQISQNSHTSRSSHNSNLSKRSQLSQRSQQTQTSGQQRPSTENSNPSKAKKEKLIPSHNVKSNPFYNAMLELIKDRRKTISTPIIIEKMKIKCVRDQQRRLRKYWNQNLRNFVEKCTELSWLMSIQDPPMDIIWKVDRGTPFDHLYFTLYSKPASKIDYIVWPVVLLHTLGPVICKGVAHAFD